VNDSFTAPSAKYERDWESLRESGREHGIDWESPGESMTAKENS